jgi:DNA helicase-2/ATP-dependent DNA helicase PcrA
MPRSPTSKAAAAAPAPALESLLAGLNPEQRDAVTTKDGPLLVLAGAGSGKTRVITVRIAWLVGRKVAPRALLAMAFTNKAAREMKARVSVLVGEAHSKEITVGTFHAFCAKLLRMRGAAVGVPPNFAIRDSADQQSALKSALRELRVAEAAISPGMLQSRISS